MNRLPAYLAFALGLTIGFMAGTAMADKSELPIRVTIIQCGTKDDAKEQCNKGVDACCSFVEPQDIEPAAGEVEPVEGDDTVNFE